MSYTAYLAGPIDQDPTHGESPAKDLLDDTLREHGFAVFRPERAWNVKGVQPNATLQKANLAVIRTVDLVVIYLPAGVPTIGTTLEMDYALRIGKPVFVRTNITNSWALENLFEHRPNVSLFPYSTEGREKFAEHLEILKESLE